MFCNNCGAKVDDNIEFCPECGKNLGKMSVEKDKGDRDATSKAVAYGVGKETGSSKGVVLKIAGAVLAVAVVAVTVFLNVDAISAMFSNNNFTIAYTTEEGGLYFKGEGFKESVKATSEFSGFYGLSEGGSGTRMAVTDDGENMFYVEGEEDLGTLYYRSVNEGEPTQKDATSKGIKISSDVYSFTMLQEGGGLIYFKEGSDADDVDIYRYDMKESYKLIADVYDFKLSEDYSKIAAFKYTDVDNQYSFDLYTLTVGKDSEKTKIDSGINELTSWDATLDTFVYEKTTTGDEETIYTADVYVNKSGEKEKIATEVYELYGAYISGDDTQLLYNKGREEKVKFMDYVEDDMAAKDAAMIEPEYDDFTTEEWVEGYYYSYWDETTDYDAYNAAMDIYSEKEDRDYIREVLEETEPSVMYYDLYQYVDGEEILLSDANRDILEYDISEDGVRVVYLGYGSDVTEKKGETTEVKKVKMSDMEALEALYDELTYGNLSEDDYDSYVYVSNGTKSLLMEKTDSGDEYLNSAALIEGGNIYLHETVGSSSKGDLYASTISGDKAESADMITEGVTQFDVYGNKVYVLKSPADEYDLGELYVVGKEEKKIGDDVRWDSLELQEDGAFTFVANTTAKDMNGDLMIYKGAKAEKLATFVAFYTYLSESDIYMLRDYSDARYYGDLYHFDGKELESIAQEVKDYRIS